MRRVGALRTVKLAVQADAATTTGDREAGSTTMPLRPRALTTRGI